MTFQTHHRLFTTFDFEPIKIGELSFNLAFFQENHLWKSVMGPALSYSIAQVTR